MFIGRLSVSFLLYVNYNGFYFLDNYIFTRVLEGKCMLNENQKHSDVMLGIESCHDDREKFKGKCAFFLFRRFECLNLFLKKRLLRNIRH